MSYQYKPNKIQLRANVQEETDDVLKNLSAATGKAKGVLIEEMLLTNELFQKALSLKKIMEEENIERLKKELGI